ncbi:MAG: glycosyltransferase WbuB, partial [Gammaproteobacteria bacterium]|nr:glycosyltransferase WbuB [Gammaproteobacteria bacterium]
MHVWLVKLEEQLPIDEGFRPYRMGMLADALVKKGHRVTRWCSDLEHLRGKNRFG